LTICCVGRLTAVKGQDVLLQAVALLKSQGVHVRALMVGAAPPHDRFGAELRDLADALGISALISWLGYQEDVLTCVRGCHVQVCPSHSEPLGRVVFEAWDAGILPIAWRDSGGSAEVIQSSGGGLLYDEQSGEGLAKVLRLALDMNIEVRREMIERGRAWLTTNCDPQVFADSMFAVWHDTLESQPN
jgi:glycosyltransferase involved in cell wall biosynthesis